MRSRIARTAPLLLGSGMCALIYQTVWLRELRLIFGSSTFASAAVLAIFMGGLGLGGALLGKRADRSPSPLMFYGNLEIIAAASSALTPFLVDLARLSYGALGGTARLGMVGATLARLVLAALVLAGPTIAMGGTLPAAARAVETEDDVSRHSLAFLYSANTLGAVTGALLSTFLLIEVYGNRTTLWLACLVNAVVGLLARGFARDLPARAPAPAPGAPPVAPAAFVLTAAAAVGFVFFLMELVWYRMLGPLLGGSTFSFGLILAVALLGIGLGGAAYAAWFRRRPATVQGFALTCLAEAACLAFPYALGDRVAIQELLLRSLGALGFAGLVTSWALVTLLVVLPAAFVAGIQFPLLIALLGRGEERVGQQVGLAYAWNTVGSIAGSLAGGFGAMPLLGAPATWRLSSLLLVAVGAAALVVSARTERGVRKLVAPVLVGALAVALTFATGPTAAWRHAPIGAGRAGLAENTPNGIERFLRQHRLHVLWEADGLESSVALSWSDGIAFLVNGKSDGHAILDAPTQVMGGMLGAALHPDPRRSLVIGLGTGSTAGWLAAMPQMERVDAVEIEPAILEVARVCAPVNKDALANPKLHVILGDAREVLTTARERYDIIFSEPSNPFRAGISSLFTREFYQAVNRNLAAGGIFIQWLQGYEVDAQTIRTALATLGSEFKDVQTWQTQGEDLLLLARQEPRPIDLEQLRRRITEEPLREALWVGWRVSGAEGLLSRYMAGDELTRQVIAQDLQPINTDDQNFIEFFFARKVGHRKDFDLRDVWRASRRLGMNKPAVKGEVDWDRVLLENALVYDRLGRGSKEAAETPGMKRLAWVRAAVGGKRAEALRLWQVEKPEPRGTMENLMLGDLLAQAKDAASLRYGEAARSEAPIEADLIAAHYYAGQGDRERATGLLESAFARHRKDAWALGGLVKMGLQLSLDIAREDVKLTARLVRALDEPFAVLDNEEMRRQILLGLTSREGLDVSCSKALDRFEPHFPWLRQMLEWRVQCYERVKDPRLAFARAEMARYRENEPITFEESLLGAAGTETPQLTSATGASTQTAVPATEGSEPGGAESR